MRSSGNPGRHDAVSRQRRVQSGRVVRTELQRVGPDADATGHVQVQQQTHLGASGPCRPALHQRYGSMNALSSRRFR